MKKMMLLCGVILTVGFGLAQAKYIIKDGLAEKTEDRTYSKMEIENLRLTLIAQRDAALTHAAKLTTQIEELDALIVAFPE